MRALQCLLDDRSTPVRELLRPTESDQVAAALLGDDRNEFPDSPDPRLELDISDAPRSIAVNELSSPCGHLVLRLIGERGNGVFVVDVQCDDVDTLAARDLEE